MNDDLFEIDMNTCIGDDFVVENVIDSDDPFGINDIMKTPIGGEYFNEMAKLSEWNGIMISMLHDTNHNAAHFHASYSGHDVSMNISGEVLAGSLPNPQLAQVKKWASLHRLELRRAWKALSNGVKPREIKPLE